MKWEGAEKVQQIEVHQTICSHKDSSIENLEEILKFTSNVFEKSQQNGKGKEIIIKQSNIQTPKQLEMRIRLRKKLEKKKSKKK